MITKKCYSCGIIKPLSEYQKQKVTADGYRVTCKACMSVRRAVPTYKKKVSLRELDGLKEVLKDACHDFSSSFSNDELNRLKIVKKRKKLENGGNNG